MCLRYFERVTSSRCSVFALVYVLYYLFQVHRFLKVRRQMERLCYSLPGVKWKMCRGILRATSVGLRRPFTERRTGNWAHMMFFHRHKGDLGEIQGTFLWELGWKTGERVKMVELPTPERKNVWEVLSLQNEPWSSQTDTAGGTGDRGGDKIICWLLLYKCSWKYNVWPPEI